MFADFCWSGVLFFVSVEMGSFDSRSVLADVSCSGVSFSGELLLELQELLTALWAVVMCPESIASSSPSRSITVG